MFKNGIHICFNFFTLHLKINMGKTSQKVTKDPKRVKAARKGRENYMNKLKESISNDVKKDGSNANNETISTSNSATSPANSTTNIATSDTYIYGVGIFVFLAIGVCVFFAYNNSQAANKKQVNEKQDQPPKRRHIL